MTTEQGKNLSEERRKYFRIDDEVILHYREVPEGVANASNSPERDAPADGFTLGSRFAALNQDLTSLMRVIKSESTATARYLSVIDVKLNMLAQVLLSQESIMANQPARNVNISAGGIAFTTDCLLNTGSDLELQMILLPEMIGLTTFGRVVVSGPSEEDPSDSRYRHSVEFVGLREVYRDLIVRHVRRREQEMLRKERANRSGPG